METFAPARDPNIESQKSTKPRIIRADFGNGYSVRAGDGLNAVPRNYQLVWDVLTTSEADAIEDFFEGKGGYTAFLYTVPLDVERQYICTEWSRSYTEAHSKISAKFEETFDLV